MTMRDKIKREMKCDVEVSEYGKRLIIATSTPYIIEIPHTFTVSQGLHVFINGDRTYERGLRFTKIIEREKGYIKVKDCRRHDDDTNEFT